MVAMVCPPRVSTRSEKVPRIFFEICVNVMVPPVTTDASSSLAPASGAARLT